MEHRSRYVAARPCDKEEGLGFESYQRCQLNWCFVVARAKCTAEGLCMDCA